MPLLRYLIGGLVALTRERCPHCGRGGESLLIPAGSAHVRGSSELLKIKRTLVNPQVMNTPGIVEYQAIVRNAVEGDPYSSDKLVVRVAIEPARRAAFDPKQLDEAIFHATEVHPSVVIEDDPSAIFDFHRELKARRIVDERAKLD